MASKQLAGRAVAVLLMALGLIAMPLAAQKPSPRLGLMAGVSLTSFTGEDASDFKSRTSFLGGGFAELPLSDMISIQPEALYNVKGAKSEEPGSNLAIKLSYFQVPVLLRVNVPTSGSGNTRIRPHLYAGPAMGFKTSCKISGNEGSVSVSADCSDFDVEAKSTELSAIFGGGIDINNFSIGARLDLGLSKIDDTNVSDSKNQVISIYASYGFTLRK